MPSLWLNLDKSENVCTSNYQITATAKPIYGENSVSSKIEFTQCAIDAENTPVLATATVNATQNPPVMEFGTADSLDTTGLTLEVPTSGVSGTVNLISRMDGTDFYNFLYGSGYSDNVLVNATSGTSQGAVNYSVPEVPFTNPDTDYFNGERRGSVFVYQKTTSKYYGVVVKQDFYDYVPDNVFVFDVMTSDGTDTVSLSYEELEADVTVVSTRDGDFYGYEAVPDSGWFDCLVDDGSVKIVCANLSGATDRSGTLVLKQKTSGNEVTLNIVQIAQKEYVFSVSGGTEHSVNIISGGSAVTVDVVSTLNGGPIGFSCTDAPDWIAVTISGNGVLYLDVKENPDEVDRDVTITLVQEGSGNEILITVTQDAAVPPDVYVFQALNSRRITASFLSDREYVWSIPVVSTCNGLQHGFSVENMMQDYGYTVDYLGKDDKDWLSFRVHSIDFELSTGLASRFRLLQNDSNNSIALDFSAMSVKVDGINGAPKRMLYVGGMTFVFLDATTKTEYEYDLLAGYYDNDGNYRSDYDFSYEIVNEIPFLTVEEFTQGDTKMIRLTIDKDNSYDTVGTIVRTTISGDVVPATVGVIIKT